MSIIVGAPVEVNASKLGGKLPDEFALSGDTNTGVGGVAPLYVETINGLYISDNSEHWLESGKVLSNVDDYPDAKQSISNNGGVYSGTNVSFASEVSAPRGMAWDGSHFFVVDSAASTLTKYTSEGVYVSEVATSISGQRSATWNGTSIAILDSTGTVTLVDYSGATLSSFDASGAVAVSDGICCDGTHYFLLDSSTASVHKFTLAGVFTNDTFSVSSEVGNAAGIEWDGVYFYVMSATDKVVYVYDALWSYTGVSFDTSSNLSGGFFDLCLADAGGLWIASVTRDGAYKYSHYTPHVGMSIAKTDTDSGLPIFVRLK